MQTGSRVGMYVVAEPIGMPNERHRCGDEVMQQAHDLTERVMESITVPQGEELLGPRIVGKISEQAPEVLKVTAECVYGPSQRLEGPVRLIARRFTNLIHELEDAATIASLFASCWTMVGSIADMEGPACLWKGSNVSAANPPCRVEEMRIGAGLSTDPDPATAGAAASAEAMSRLGGAGVSLALVVASRHHSPSAGVVSEAVRLHAMPERVIGCVAETVVGGGREVESGPAVAVWLASLPQPVESFHIEFVRTSEGGVFGGYRFEEAGPASYLLIGDPFSFPTDLLLAHLNERVPGTVVVGGMASGGMGPGETRLFLDERVVDTGAVGARLPGVRIRPLVSQGCRPIGNALPQE